MHRRRAAAWEERPSGLVTPVAVDPTGRTGPTRGRAYGPTWRQTSAGRFVPMTSSSVGVHQRILEQGTRIRSHGAVTAWASLRYRGARWFDGWLRPCDDLAPIPIVTGPALLRPDPRIVLTREQLALDEREMVGGIWLTTPARALFDEIRRHGLLREAVADIEVAVSAGLLAVEDIARYVAARGPWTGIQLARDAVRLAGLGCWSRTEVRMALTWILDADLGRPLCNVPIFDLRGRLIAIVDLFDPVAGCAGEYQGEHHKDGARHREDVVREQALRDVGIECFEVVGGDLSDRELVAKRMHAARERSLFRTPTKRLWTLDQPAWWPAWAAAHGL